MVLASVLCSLGWSGLISITNTWVTLILRYHMENQQNLNPARSIWLGWVRTSPLQDHTSHQPKRSLNRGYPNKKSWRLHMYGFNILFNMGSQRFFVFCLLSTTNTAFSWNSCSLLVASSSLNLVISSSATCRALTGIRCLEVSYPLHLGTMLWVSESCHHFCHVTILADAASAAEACSIPRVAWLCPAMVRDRGDS